MKVSVSENVAPQGIPSNPFGSFCIGTADAGVLCRINEKKRLLREMQQIQGNV
jgi:hypothetical protein